MRIAKMTMNGENALIGGACKKFNIEAVAYPVNVVSGKKSMDVYFTMILSGEEKNKKSFFNYLKKHKRISGIEKKGDFIIGRLKEKDLVKPMYKYSILHIEPIHIDNKGTETWTIGSFDSNSVDKFVHNMMKLFNSKLIRMQNQLEPNISILTVHPKLTNLQKKALESAIKEGYYEYPRRADLQDIAKSTKMSYSTFHAHLRKAERRIMPFLFGQSKTR